jgi:hypothetical protein
MTKRFCSALKNGHHFLESSFEVVKLVHETIEATVAEFMFYYPEFFKPC